MAGELANRQEEWSAGAAYEPYVGRWSRLVARAFLDWLAAPAGAEWLDVGCGTGALTETILARAKPRRILGVDQAQPFLDFARGRIADGRVEFRQGSAQAVPCEDEAFDAAVSGLMLNFVPDPLAAVREMRRAVRPGGVVAVYVWDYAGEMQFMRRFWDAAAALDPAARELDEGRRFPLCDPERLSALFREAGLSEIAGRAIDIPTVFRDFDDYWTPFLGGQGPAPGYCLSLSEPARAALRDRLRALVPAAADGTIALSARAFAVRGIRVHA